MNYYITLDKRVSKKRNDYDKYGISENISLQEKSEDEKAIQYVAQNRTLDEKIRMMLNVYYKDGVELSFYGEKAYAFQHELPFTGVLHKHEFIEFFYVVDGSFEQILLGEKHVFRAGDFVITDQNCEHSDYLTSTDASVLFLQIGSDYLDELLQSYDERDDLQRFLFHALRRQKKEQSFLHLQEMNMGRQKSLHLLEQLFEEMIEPDAGVSEICKGLLLRLLKHLCMNYRPLLHSDSKESKEKATLYEVERHIRVHFSTVTSEELEQIFHYHRNYFNLLLRKYRGVTFKQYLIDVRLNKARELLQTTQLPIKEIIRKVGYENTSHFYHLYEKKYGKVPSR